MRTVATMRIRDEDGQALLLALAFLVFFGLVIGFMLSFAEVSERATVALRDQRYVVYAADGATDGAIQYVRSNPALGTFGSIPACPTLTSTIFTATVNQKTATVNYCSKTSSPGQLDRDLQFTTTVDGLSRVVARAVFHDSTAGSGLPQVDVLCWTYDRTTGCP